MLFIFYTITHLLISAHSSARVVRVVCVSASRSCAKVHHERSFLFVETAAAAVIACAYYYGEVIDGGRARTHRHTYARTYTHMQCGAHTDLLLEKQCARCLSQFKNLNQDILRPALHYYIL